MTLLDSNVLIASVRRADLKLRSLFRNLPGAVCGAVRAEFLHGAKDAADQVHLLAILDALVQVPTPETVWDETGDLLFRLRKNGIIVPFNDAVIASVAVAADIELWTRDNQFQLIQRFEPRLRLFQEPP
ncbi:MAG: PIN domain-containing protein [Gemmataceae bacterium]|nr:PIN domain-containing protein [Gemmataceae bacterium]